MKALELKYKQIFRNKLRWYKQDQGSPLLKCITDDFDTVIKDIFLELEELNKEDKYMFEKINESLRMGSKAQSIATLEIARILKKRVEAKGE